MIKSKIRSVPNKKHDSDISISEIDILSVSDDNTSTDQSGTLEDLGETIQ